MKSDLDRLSRDALIQYRLQRAKDTLSESEKIIELGFTNSSVNRLYYACYYAIVALLISEGIQTHTHVGTKQMFSLHFIRNNRISKESGRFYSQLFNERITGDYDDFISYDLQTVNELFEKSKKLIKEIETFLTDNCP